MAKKKVQRRKEVSAEMISDFYDLKKVGISQSSMKTFMTCRRKWMLNIAGLERKDKQRNTHFGTIVHEMLDQVYQNIQTVSEEELERFVRRKLNKYLKKSNEGQFLDPEQYDLEKEMCVASVTAYFEFFEKDREQFTESVPEYEFAIPYKDVTLRGKIDGLFRRKNGQRWQMEHKTKSRWDEEAGLQALLFDFQNLMYSFAAEAESDEPIKGILYNIIRKPQLRRKKDETNRQFLLRVKEDIASRPDWYFTRYEIVYSERDKRNFRQQLDGILEDLKLFCAGKLCDHQNTAMCLYPFKCEFLPVCSQGTTAGLVLRDTIHPELEADFKPDPRILERYGIDPDSLR